MIDFGHYILGFSSWALAPCANCPTNGGVSRNHIITLSPPSLKHWPTEILKTIWQKLQKQFPAFLTILNKNGNYLPRHILLRRSILSKCKRGQRGRPNVVGPTLGWTLANLVQGWYNPWLATVVGPWSGLGWPWSVQPLAGPWPV